MTLLGHCEFYQVLPCRHLQTLSINWPKSTCYKKGDFTFYKKLAGYVGVKLNDVSVCCNLSTGTYFSVMCKVVEYTLIVICQS